MSRPAFFSSIAVGRNIALIEDSIQAPLTPPLGVAAAATAISQERSFNCESVVTKMDLIETEAKAVGKQH